MAQVVKTMSILAVLRGWLSSPNRPDDRLVAECSLLVKGIHALETAETRREATRHGRGVGGRERWQSWRWLIDAHNSTQEQIALLRGCSRLMQRARAIRLGDERKEEFERRIIACFRERKLDGFSEVEDFSELDEALHRHANAWNNVADDVREAKPPVFISHAFLKLSDSTGVEMASLFVAGIIALGAVYMAFFYATVAGQAASAYWTLDDLVIHGIRVLPQIALALVVIEVVFAIVRRVFGGRESYRWHGFIMKHPIRIGIMFFFAMGVLLCLDGHRRGLSKYDDFARTMNGKDRRERQVATVLDRTVLDNVYLVGTTDRTAIFLQMKNPDSAVSESSPSNLAQALDCVASSFGLSNEPCDGGTRPNHRVLVMDRALVVCHAKMSECQKPSADDTGTRLDAIREDLASVGASMTVLNAWSRRHQEDVRDRFISVNSHVNRHRNQILKEIGKKMGTNDAHD